MKKSNKVLWIFVGVVFSVILVLSAIRSANYSFNPKKSSSFSFNFSGNKNIIGNNKMASKSVPLTKFDALNIGADFDVELNPGTQNTATIISDENILPYVIVAQDNNQMSINMQPGIFISSSQPKKIIITSAMPLHQINLSGKTTLHAIKLNSDNLALNMQGKNSADIQGNIKKIEINLHGKSVLHLKIIGAESIVLNIQGMGRVNLSGNTQNLNIRTSGKSTVLANDLIADHVIITGRGMSDISVHAVKTLSILSSGKSDIQYSGNPSVNRNESGDASVEKVKNGMVFTADSKQD